MGRWCRFSGLAAWPLGLIASPVQSSNPPPSPLGATGWIAYDDGASSLLSAAAMVQAGPSSVVLLGAQRFQPSLGTLVSEAGITGRIALITAGWQEREPEVDELSAHLGGDTINLRLHERATAIFHQDRVLSAWHRERQQLLRHLQEIYRLRLEHAFDAERDKPYPAPLHMALAPGGIDAGPAVWFIGDADIDMTCGANAGCIPILIRPEKPGQGEFPDHPPLHHFATCRQLCNFIQTM